MSDNLYLPWRVETIDERCARILDSRGVLVIQGAMHRDAVPVIVDAVNALAGYPNPAAVRAVVEAARKAPPCGCPACAPLQATLAALDATPPKETP